MLCPFSPHGGVGKFATLNDMDRHSCSKEEGEAFYAGGSERSGQQHMFRMALEHSSSGYPWGQGVRLGKRGAAKEAGGEKK